MEHNMTGNPNQNSPSSVFRFDSYPGIPGPSNVFPWDTNMQKPEYPSPNPQFNSLPLFSNYVPSQIIQSMPQPQVPANFSFGAQSTEPVGQFPFQITNHGFGEKSFKLVLGKRKTDSPTLQPFKQHITEEKMAEHMSKLHISSETASATLEPESVKNKRLYMCEEMRKLQSESLLPPCLISQIQRPCTALVLWQPPAKMVPTLSDQSRCSDSDSEDLNENSKNVRDMEDLDIDSAFSGNMEMDS